MRMEIKTNNLGYTRLKRDRKKKKKGRHHMATSAAGLNAVSIFSAFGLGLGLNGRGNRNVS